MPPTTAYSAYVDSEAAFAIIQEVYSFALFHPIVYTHPLKHTHAHLCTHMFMQGQIVFVSALLLWASR